VAAHDIVHGDWQDDVALEAAVTAFVREQKLAEDDVFTVLPRHEMTTRFLRLPTQEPDEVANMVRLTAEEHVPFALADLIVDYAMLQRLPDGESRVLAVYAHREVVEHHLRIVRAAGVEPEQIYLSSSCVASAALAAAGTAEERLAVISLASGGMEVIVVGEGRLEYGRGVGADFDWSLQGEKAEEAAEELKVEVRASLSAYRRESEHGLGVERIWVCSEVFDSSRACEMLEAETGYPCTPATEALDLVNEGRQHLQAVPLVSIGAAMAAQGRGAVILSLLPRTIAEARRKTRMKTQALTLVAVIALALVSVVVVYAQAVQQRRAYIAELERQVATLSPVVADVREQQSQLEILQERVERGGSVLELLAALTDIAPSRDLNITHLFFDYGDRIVIRGRARDLEAVRDLGEDLREAGRKGIPQFAQAHEVYRNQGIMERDQEVVEFAIELPFEVVEEQSE
jgi:type II secretory pathway component PulL